MVFLSSSDSNVAFSDSFFSSFAPIIFVAPESSRILRARRRTPDFSALLESLSDSEVDLSDTIESSVDSTALSLVVVSPIDLAASSADSA